MEKLQPPRKFLGFAAESLGQVDAQRGFVPRSPAERNGELFLAEAVFVKLLGRPRSVHIRREHVMKAKLTGKHVGHDFEGILLVCFVYLTAISRA